MNSMKYKFVLALACLFLIHSMPASSHHNGEEAQVKKVKHKPKAVKDEDNSIFITANGPMLCNVNISPTESREIVIIKMQQRMDCMEAKLNELGKQLGNALVNNSLKIEK